MSREPTGRPRILVLANRLPYPLDDGWKVRSFHMVRSLAATADTTLLVFHPGEDAALQEARKALGPSVRIESVPSPPSYTAINLLRGLLTATPVHVWNQQSATLRSRIRELQEVAPFDVCVTEAIFMFEYMRLLRGDAIRVVDTHNIDSVTMERYARTLSSLPRRLYARITASRFRSFEKRTFSSADIVWVCSEKERDLVTANAAEGVVDVIPNGVDTLAMAPSGRTPVRGRLIFFGRLDYFPNEDGLEHFVREILPLIRQRRPDVELHIVGPAATPRVRSLAQANQAITIRGRVEDVRPVLEEAEVIVVPLRVGGGTRLKILEALSMERAVVSTSIGAEGLDLLNGSQIVLADSTEQFASAVLRLLGDVDARARLGEAGRKVVQQKYDWSSIGGLARESVTGRLRMLRGSR